MSPTYIDNVSELLKCLRRAKASAERRDSLNKYQDSSNKFRKENWKNE